MLIPLQIASDARVVRRVLGGRRDDFGVLVERYYGAVESVARARLSVSADAEDVAQEAFLKAYKKLDTLAEGGKFGPWLMAIARNMAVSHVRRRQKEVLVAEAPAESGKEPGMERAELQRLVRAKLDEMAPEQREILLLFYYGDKSVGEIASLLQISKAAAGKRLQRARASLGAEFLRTIGESGEPRDVTRARRSVMAAIASAPVVWQTKAAAAGAASVLAVKALIGLLAVVLVGAGVSVSVKYARSKPAEPGGRQPAAPVKQLAEAAAPAAAAEPAPAPGEDTAEVTGPCRLDVILLDGNTQQPVGNAEVTAELVTWSAREMPPEITVRKTGRSDGQGQIVLDNLPKGAYCVTAVTETQCGVNDYTFRSKTSGRVRLWMRERANASGRLVGPDDAPVSGAVIYPFRHVLIPRFSHTEVASVRAVTDAEGRFEFPLIVPGGFQFYILAEGFPPAITGLHMLGEELDLKLKAPGAIAGRVVNADTGGGVGRIVVRAHAGDKVQLSMAGKPEYGWRIAVEAETGPDGSFRVADLAPGKYKIESGDAALLNKSPDTEFEVKPGGETTAEIKLAVGGTIMGRVYDAETGKGMAGVAIRGDWPRVITDANGEYMITRLPAGAYDLRVAYPTNDETWPFRSTDDPSLKKTVTVTYGQVLEGVDFAATPPACVRGRVVDRGGAPVAGASVEVVDGNFPRETETDAAGAFDEMLFSTENLRLLAKKDGWQSELVTPDNVSEEVVLTLNVPCTGTISGKAMSAEGKPLADHRVNAYAFDANSGEAQFWSSAEGRAGPDGAFELKNLAAGTYELRARAAVASSPVAATARVEVADGQALRNVTLRPEMLGDLSIAGRVITPDGGELPGGQVELAWPSDRRARIMPDGRFELKGLREGTYTVAFDVAGYSPTAVEDVPAGAQNLTVRLKRPAALNGRVVDAGTGEPVSVFDLKAFTRPMVMSEVVTTNVVETYRNEEGRFEFEKFAAMPVVLEASADGYAPAVKQLTLEGGKINEVTIELESAGVVRGSVLDGAGRPVEGATISLASTDIGPVLNRTLARTDADGRFVIRALPGGVSVQLETKHPNYANDCVEIIPRRDEPTDVEFVLQPPGGLEVRAYVGGEATTSGYVKRNSACEGMLMPFSDGSMGLVQNGLPAGEAAYTAVVYNAKGQIQQQTFEATVVPGETTVVEVRFDAWAEDLDKR